MAKAATKRVVALLDMVGYADAKGGPHYLSRGEQGTISAGEFKRLHDDHKAAYGYPAVAEADSKAAKAAETAANAGAPPPPVPAELNWPSTDAELDAIAAVNNVAFDPDDEVEAKQAKLAAAGVSPE